MESGARRVHHSYIWLGGLRSGGIVTVAIILSSLGGLMPFFAGFVGGDYGIGPLIAIIISVLGSIAIVALIIGINVLVYWLSWRYLSYELSQDEFNLYSGIFSKKRLHVPYQRVQSVDIRASLLQRIAGVCSVEIDTAGGSSNKAIMVPYVTKSDAEELKVELFRRKRMSLSGTQVPVAESSQVADGRSNILDDVQGVFGDAMGVFDEGGFVDEEPISYKTGLSNKELLFAGLSEANGSVGLILFTIISFCCTVGLWDFFMIGVGDYLDQYFEVGMAAGAAVDTLIIQLLCSFIPYLIAVCIASYVITAAMSAVISLVSYGGFQVRRRGSRIEVERGLLQHQTQGIDVDRIQLLRVEHGWIRRFFGYCKVCVGRIDSAGSDEGKKQANVELAQGVVVHPFLRTSELESFLASLLPEMQCECQVRVAPAKGKLRRAMLRGALWQNWGFWTVACIVASELIVAIVLALGAADELPAYAKNALSLSRLMLVFLIPIVIGAVRGAKWYRGSSLEYGNGYVRIVNEGFSCKEVVVPRQKIQFGALIANPFQLAQDLRNVQVTTAAGSGGTPEVIWDIDLEDAEAFYEWMRPKR